MDESIDNYLGSIKEQFGIAIKQIDSHSIQRAADLILHCEKQGGRVHVSGIGKPSYVAGYIASLLSSTGTPAYVLDGTEAIHGSAGQVREKDVVIAISNSGETMELIATVKTLLSNQAHIISCTGNDQSWLAKQSEICLLAHVKEEGDSLNKPPRSSILVEILILQCLSIVLQERRGLSLTEYGKWHPGGQLGKSMQLKGENYDNS